MIPPAGMSHGVMLDESDGRRVHSLPPETATTPDVPGAAAPPGTIMSPREWRAFQRRALAERCAAVASPSVAVPRADHEGARRSNSRYSDRAAVVVYGNLDAALRTFKRGVERAGILKELRRRQAFMGPAESRRLKSKKARVRVAKAAARRPDGFDDE